jgi:hypothetical protein
LKPGQLRTDLVGLVAIPEGGWDGALQGRVDVALGRQWGLHALGGVVRYPWGDVSPRDALVGTRWQFVSKDDVAASLSPRVSLPLGNVSDAFVGQPGATGSVDPALGADLYVGGTWIVALEGSGRVPLYEGADGLRQGPFARGELRGARRVGDWVGALGLGSALGFPAEDGTGGFTEVTAVAAASFAPWKRHALSARVGVPVWTNGENYRVSVLLGWSAVWLRKEPGHAPQ